MLARRGWVAEQWESLATWGECTLVSFKLAAAGAHRSNGSRARSGGYSGRHNESEGIEGPRRSERGRRICIPLDAL
eukprot:10615743-Heterocapsa_arctica.AAC.1